MTDNQKEIIRLNDLVGKFRKENFELKQKIKELNKREFVPDIFLSKYYDKMGITSTKV